MRLKRKPAVISGGAQKSDTRAGSKVSVRIGPPTKQPVLEQLPKGPKNFSAMEGFSAGPKVVKDINSPQPTSPKDESKTVPGKDVGEPNIDDQTTDAAIEDIVISESNELLAVHDAALEAETAAKEKPKKRFSFKGLLKNKWLYFSLGLILIIIFGIPYSRYHILGLFLKNDYQFSVLDSTTNTAISGATVQIQGKTLTTNGSGQVNFDLSLGKHSYLIKKQYYQADSASMFVGLDKSKTHDIYLKATGRRVPIKVVDKLSGKPLSGAEVSILDTNAKTGTNGEAYIILPTSSSDYLATITYAGYNSVTTRIIVSLNVSANTVNLVPDGSIYFLSNSSGTINVVKANLDGSDPQVELAGTGNEKSNTTFLMPSPDWKYLLLEAQRSSNQPELYIINAASGQVNEFDSSADSFNLIGWSGDQFIYDEVNSADPTSTAGREQLKSYNADTQQLNVLDQNQVNGDTSSYGYQSFYNFKLLSSVVMYNTEWTSTGGYDISSSSDTIRGVEPNGLNKKDYYSFPAASTGQITVARYQAESLYFAVPDTSTSQTTYYTYTNGAVSSGGNAAAVSQAYPTYYLSPSGEQTLWDDSNSVQTEIYEGDQNGQNQKLISLPSGYTAYGWYDNVYILLSKNGQLYISPATGSKSPILIGSYFSPTT